MKHTFILPISTSVNKAYRHVEVEGRPPFRVRTKQYNDWLKELARLLAQREDLTKHMYKERKQLQWELTIEVNVDHTSDVTNRIKTTEDGLAEWLGLSDAWNERTLAYRYRQDPEVPPGHMHVTIVILEDSHDEPGTREGPAAESRTDEEGAGDCAEGAEVLQRNAAPPAHGRRRHRGPRIERCDYSPPANRRRTDRILAKRRRFRRGMDGRRLAEWHRDIDGL